MKPSISVIIPCFNPHRGLLEKLYASLAGQTLTDFEAILVDDHSSRADYGFLKDPRFRVIFKPANTGPADSRNAGAGAAASDSLFFTDSDCELSPRTLETAARLLGGEDAVMGDTVTRPASFIGRIVAFMGFPGGGSIGFSKVWKVSPDGYTQSVSSCNLAIRKDVFFGAGRFDAGFPVPGGEDTVFGKVLTGKNIRIKHEPVQVVYHVEKDSLPGFVKWQLTRGRGNYHIKRKLGRIGGFLKLRLWSFRNSLRAAGPFYAPFVAALFALAAVCQTIGYHMEKRKEKTDADL